MIEEQYPKFYKYPHYWINTVEVEVVTPHTIYDGKGGSWSYNIGEKSSLNYPIYCDHKYEILKYYKPLFKPQEGDQFIKDLEEAVSAGLSAIVPQVKWVEADTTPNAYCFTRLDGEVEIAYVLVSKHDIAKVKCHEWDGDTLLFDTAAYTDKLRQLGYYL